MARTFVFDVDDDLTKIVLIEHSGTNLVVDVRYADDAVVHNETFLIETYGIIETEEKGVGVWVHYRTPLTSWFPLLVWRKRWF